jgi:enoyl-CoA hydratase/carnithine racemase
LPRHELIFNKFIQPLWRLQDIFDAAQAPLGSRKLAGRPVCLTISFSLKDMKALPETQLPLTSTSFRLHDNIQGDAFMNDVISYLQDGVLTLRLNRPAKKNALTKAMYSALTDGLALASVDEAVRVVLIAAQGDDFCAGNDILDFAQDLPLYQDETADHDALPVFRFLKAITFFDKPLIAAVQGQAVGVGVTLLLHCDLVVASGNIRLSLPFLKLGLVPEAGSTFLLPERIGHARAFAWMALGEAISADEAKGLGLINSVTAREDLESAAKAMAQKLVRLSPSSLKHTKAFMRDPEKLWQVIRAEGAIFRRQLITPEVQAAFMAFLSK